MKYKTSVKSAPVTEKLMNRDYDVFSGASTIAFENAVELFEIQHIKLNAERLAMEAYIKNDGKMTSVLESQMIVLREDAQESVWEKIKTFFRNLIQKIKNFGAKVMDFITKIFSSNEKFLARFASVEKDNTTTEYTGPDLKKMQTAIHTLGGSGTNGIYDGLVKKIKEVAEKSANNDTEYFSKSKDEYFKDQILPVLSGTLGPNTTFDSYNNNLKEYIFGKEPQKFTVKGSEVYAILKDLKGIYRPFSDRINGIINFLSRVYNKIVAAVSKEGSVAEKSASILASLQNCAETMFSNTMTALNKTVSICRHCIFDIYKQTHKGAVPADNTKPAAAANAPKPAEKKNESDKGAPRLLTAGEQKAQEEKKKKEEEEPADFADSYN